MPETSTTPTKWPALSRNALRVVLFGMPDAGKSSLLGALAQAAQTQEHLLNGHLTDSSRGLAELQRRVYEDQPRETLEEVVPYPVVFEPFVPYTRGGDARTEAVLVDCDGRVANELLARRRALQADGEDGSLARAILEADVLILAIDASATPSQVDADFAEFGRFLRLLEQSRGRRSDVGGLPVFLVLTKGDLLALPTDTPADWIDRIEERKRQVHGRFQEFIARHQTEGPLPFGRIDLHVWATAVKRPSLAGTPAKPREPYGVAELFRQAFESARAFQGRRTQAGWRLFWTVTGGTGLVAVMAGLGIFLAVNRTGQQTGPRELLNQIDTYRAGEPQTPSSRLREPLQPKISTLTELTNATEFGKLPEDTQEYILSRLRELKDYEAYKNKLLQVPLAGAARSERDLERIETRLNELTLPAEHRSDWSQTEASLFRARQLSDVKGLRVAVSEVEDWYRRLIRRGEDLWAFAGQKAGAPVSWSDWQNQVQGLVEEAETPPHRPGDRLPGATLTYESVYGFDRVIAARGEWDRTRQRLQRVSDLATALGLAGPQPGRSPLDIPASFTADQAAGRLQELRKVYPRFRDEFTPADLPEAVAGEVRRAAQTRYEHALKAGRQVVLRHLQDGHPDAPETPESWRRLGPWLAAPEDLRDWGELATVLARLQNPDANNPVNVLEAFVRQERFDLVLRRLVVVIPDDLKARPVGKLSVHHQSGGENRPPLTFELAGDERYDARRRVTTYTFQAVEGTSLTYKVGDVLWMDGPVKHGDEADWLLTWAASRSQVYQFERLTEKPRLHRKDQVNTEGELAEGVAVEVVPEGGVPKVPDLVPRVPVKGS